MSWPRRLILILVGIGLAFAGFAVWGGVGFFGSPHYSTRVTIASNVPPSTPHRKKKPPPTTTMHWCTPGKVVYFADQPGVAHNDFGRHLVAGLSPYYEPVDTPKPDTQLVVIGTKFRTCHDPALTRDIVAAVDPTWSGLHGHFKWGAALNVLAQGHWNTAHMVYYSVAPSPWTMMMVPNGRGPPTTYITHAPYQGWYLEVTILGHQLLLRVGCGDQPVLYLSGYQAPLLKLFATR